MNKQIKARKLWVDLYLETHDAGYVCRNSAITHEISKSTKINITEIKYSIQIRIYSC